MFFLATIFVGWIGGDFLYRKVAAKNIIVIMFFLAATLVGWVGGDFLYRKVAAKNIFL